MAHKAHMLPWLLLLLSFYLPLFSAVYDDTITRNSASTADVTCNPSATSCLVDCIASQSCYDGSGAGEGSPVGTGIKIHCPTNSGCTLCDINCVGSYSCKYAHIQTYECDVVNIKGGNLEAGRQMRIDAPIGGVLDVGRTSSISSDNEMYRSMDIFGHNTESITI